ncbi:GerMN domain-containing protein [Catellatospora sichuanensis]|uniref:GerMN domain-containing protein n=1 Tax=Catellatospora sichuanensis TaxID=1969805 RepID=UPI001183A60F|nr:GerMN domain-containing protein [Catellatospora sichuanensis]
MNPARSAAAAALGLLLAAGATGCGVPAEDTARIIEQSATASPAAPTPAAEATGPATEKLYLLRDGHLVAVQRRVSANPDAQQLLAHLLAGPTPAEQDADLTSALTGTTAINSATDAAGSATVELSTALEGTGRSDDVLAFGQLVCTLSSRPDINQVVFTRQGARVGVPRGNGALTEDPLTCADYANLVTA